MDAECKNRRDLREDRVSVDIGQRFAYKSLGLGYSGGNSSGREDHGQETVEEGKEAGKDQTVEQTK